MLVEIRAPGDTGGQSRHQTRVSADEKADIVAEFTRRAMPKFADRTIVPIIEKVFPIDEVVAAHRMMEEDQHFGKIVLKISD